MPILIGHIVTGWIQLKFNFRPAIKVQILEKQNFSGIKLKLHIQYINQQIRLKYNKIQEIKYSS